MSQMGGQSQNAALCTPLKAGGYPEAHCWVAIMEETWSDLVSKGSSKSDGLRALRAVGIGKKQFLG